MAWFMGARKSLPGKWAFAPRELAARRLVVRVSPNNALALHLGARVRIVATTTTLGTAKQT